MTNDTGMSDGLSGLDELWRDGEGADHETDPAGRRRRRRIALIVTAVVALIAIGVPTAYVGWALNAPVSAPEISSQTPQVATPAAAVLDLPVDGSAAISVSGGEAYLGPAASGVWASSGTNEPRPIASITKLITALVVLDAKPLASADDPGPTITFDKADHDLYDAYYVLGATIGSMPTGSSMSQRDALAAMLIPSASNYADAVSTWAFGSHSGFVTAARRWLDANGLTDTTIVEPTGINARNVSTPTDLIALGRLAAAQPTVAALTATSSMLLPNLGHVSNTNALLQVNGITGLKTGNLGANRHNLLYTARLGVGGLFDLSVTGVQLGGASDDSVDRDVLGLLESIRAGFHDVPLATAGQQVGSLSTRWGESATLVIAESEEIFTWSDTPISTTMQMTTPETYQDGEVVGTITWTAGPNTETSPIAIEGTIEQPSEWWRLTHPGELGGE